MVMYLFHDSGFWRHCNKITSLAQLSTKRSPSWPPDTSVSWQLCCRCVQLLSVHLILFVLPACSPDSSWGEQCLFCLLWLTKVHLHSLDKLLWHLPALVIFPIFHHSPSSPKVNEKTAEKVSWCKYPPNFLVFFQKSEDCGHDSTQYRVLQTYLVATVR